jgi:hypothetical protein
MKHSDARTPDEIAAEFEALHGRKLGKDSCPAHCYRLLDESDDIRSTDEFLEDDAEHWSQMEHSLNYFNAEVSHGGSRCDH